MKYANQYTYQINTTDHTIIKSRDAFKVKVRNDSPGNITVAGLIIEPKESETFDGLPADCVFEKDFELNLNDVRNPVIFVTLYQYVERTC